MMSGAFHGNSDPLNPMGEGFSKGVSSQAWTQDIQRQMDARDNMDGVSLQDTIACIMAFLMSGWFGMFWLLVMHAAVYFPFFNFVKGTPHRAFSSKRFCVLYYLALATWIIGAGIHFSLWVKVPVLLAAVVIGLLAMGEYGQQVRLFPKIVEANPLFGALQFVRYPAFILGIYLTALLAFWVSGSAHMIKSETAGKITNIRYETEVVQFDSGIGALRLVINQKYDRGNEADVLGRTWDVPVLLHGRQVQINGSINTIPIAVINFENRVVALPIGSDPWAKQHRASMRTALKFARERQDVVLGVLKERGIDTDKVEVVWQTIGSAPWIAADKQIVMGEIIGVAGMSPIELCNKGGLRFNGVWLHSEDIEMIRWLIEEKNLSTVVKTAQSGEQGIRKTHARQVADRNAAMAALDAAMAGRKSTQSPSSEGLFGFFKKQSSDKPSRVSGILDGAK